MQKCLVICVAASMLTGTPTGSAQTKSAQVVKTTATATKADADGNQVITITLDIDPMYTLFANPAGNEDFQPNATVVTVTGKSKPQSVKVEYPAGAVVKDKIVGDYRVYRGRVVIKAKVRRKKGDPGPLEVTVRVKAYSPMGHPPPSSIKITVP